MERPTRFTSNASCDTECRRLLRRGAKGGGGGGRVGTPKWTIKKGGASSRTVSLEAFHCSVFLYRCCHISLGLAGYPGGVFTRFNVISMRLFFITCIDVALIASIRLSQPALQIRSWDQTRGDEMLLFCRHSRTNPRPPPRTRRRFWPSVK